MAEALEIRVRDLLPEFFADALVLLRALQTAGAIAAGTLQAVFHHLYHLFVFIQTNCHLQDFPSMVCYGKDHIPDGIWSFGGELGIRTLGSFRNHQFSRLAP